MKGRKQAAAPREPAGPESASVRPQPDTEHHARQPGQNSGQGNDQQGNAQQGNGQQQRNGEQSGQRKQGRSAAEWISLGISALLVLGVMGFVSYLHFTGPDAPVLLEVQPRLEEVYQGVNAYYLPVEITNLGTQTAESARVRVTLADPAGNRETGELEIQFLAGQATHRGVVAFTNDPRQGAVTAEASSFLKP